MNTFLHGRQITQLFAYSLDNNPHPEEDLLGLLATDEKLQAVYCVPNDIPSYGSASAFRDHLDSMRFTCDRVATGDSVGFAVRMSDGEIIALTPEYENEITD